MKDISKLIEFAIIRLSNIASDIKLIGHDKYYANKIEQDAETGVKFLKTEMERIYEESDENCDEETQNKTVSEIEDMYSILEEAVRHNLSAKLMHTSEDNPLEVNISLEFGYCGISCAEMPTITSIFQDPSEGIIWVKYEYAGDYTELDELHIEDKIQIAKDLDFYIE